MMQVQDLTQPPCPPPDARLANNQALLRNKGVCAALNIYDKLGLPFPLCNDPLLPPPTLNPPIPFC